MGRRAARKPRETRPIYELRDLAVAAGWYRSDGCADTRRMRGWLTACGVRIYPRGTVLLADLTEHVPRFTASVVLAGDATS